jgi:DnaK suppressor protein
VAKVSPWKGTLEENMHGTAVQDYDDTSEEPMDQKKLEKFRSLLTERLEDLLLEAGVTDIVKDNENLPDSIDLATEESIRDFRIRMKDRERKLIIKIRRALTRMDEGDYGECVVCGEVIGERRLEIRPVTTHCIDCKTEAETQERVRGL